MAPVYGEIDVPLNLWVREVAAKILQSSDWSDVSPTTPSTTLSASAAVGATSVSVTSTAGFTSGMVIVFEEGTANEERRTVNSVGSSTLSVTGTTFAHASGTAVKIGSKILKATTTRGAQMVVDLAGAVPQQNYMTPIFYRTFDAGVGTDPITRYLTFRRNTSGATWTMPLHATVAASKEMLLVTAEGPRAWETGASSTSYGSLRGYLFISSLLPYHAEDTTPAVVVGGPSLTNSPTSTVGNNSHLAYVSREHSSQTAWGAGRLLSLSQPCAGYGSYVTSFSSYFKPESRIDGREYLAPYVFVSETEGLRGRAEHLFFAGYNGAASSSEFSAPVGKQITFEGRTYRLVTVDKNDGTLNQHVWGSLGVSSNGNTDMVSLSPVVAVPVA